MKIIVRWENLVLLVISYWGDVMKYQYFLLMFIALFLNLSPVLALDCSNQEEIEKYRVLAKNVEIKYNYISDSSQIDQSKLIRQSSVLSDDIYQVSVNGLVSGLFLMDDDYNRFDGDDNQGITFYAKAGTLNFKVFLSQCNTNYFRIVSATLPKYNHYSQSDLCQSLRDYHLDFCGEWYQGDMSMDLLLEKAGPYLDQMSDDEERISILSFVRQHVFWFAGGGVVLLLLILFLIIRYRKRYILD